MAYYRRFFVTLQQALYFASKEIRDDREIVKLAVENKGIILVNKGSEFLAEDTIFKKIKNIIY